MDTSWRRQSQASWRRRKAGAVLDVGDPLLTQAWAAVLSVAMQVWEWLIMEGVCAIWVPEAVTIAANSKSLMERSPDGLTVDTSRCLTCSGHAYRHA